MIVNSNFQHHREIEQSHLTPLLVNCEPLGKMSDSSNNIVQLETATPYSNEQRRSVQFFDDQSPASPRARLSPREKVEMQKYQTSSPGMSNTDTISPSLVSNALRHKNPKEYTIDRTYTRRFNLYQSGSNNFRRIMFKNGNPNIIYSNVYNRNLQFFNDFFSTMVDMRWRYALLIFVCAFNFSWLGYAVIWWLIGYAHNDFIPENVENPDWKRCAQNVYDFPTALLFSIETQHTIGYGFRYANSFCPESIVTVILQSLSGVIIQGFMTGLVFAKLARPKKRSQTVIFSKTAVICTRDGVRQLLIRVGDMRQAHFICCNVKGIIVQKRITEEGEVIPLGQFKISLGVGMPGNESSDIFFAWPVIIAHTIDSSSPLWNFTKNDFEKRQFELVIFLEGVSQSTGQTTQSRTSYMPTEILWGYRFERMSTYQKETTGEYQLDYTSFHKVIRFDNFPPCSAAEAKGAATRKDEVVSDSEPDFDYGVARQYVAANVI